MKDFISKYSNQFDTLNEDVIKNIRLKDDMTGKIEEACIELQRHLGNMVEYIGFTYDDTRAKFKESAQQKKKGAAKSGKGDDIQYMNINPSYSRLAVFKFRINYEGRQTINMPIYIPQFIDDYHYYIRGNKYAAPYQLTDAITYLGKDNSVVLKTMTRAIKLSREKTIITDAHGVSYPSHNFYIHINSKKVSFLLYYYAYYGFTGTMDYFGCKDMIKMFENCPIEPDNKWIIFKYGKIFLGVDRVMFMSNIQLRQYVASSLLLARKSIDVEHIEKVIHWRTILGSVVSERKATEKGGALIWTFISSLDFRTKQNIKDIVGGFPKESMFAVVRWMFISFGSLSNKNNSLANKRLRLSEYIVTPFVRDIYTKLYRFLNTPLNMRDKKRLLDIFKVSPNIILNAIIGKTKNKRQALGIAKYSSHVNDFSLITVALKYTIAGPSSVLENNAKMASNRYRQFDPSFVGQVDITTSSAGSPGIASLVSPFAKVNTDTLCFEIADEK